jgi:hypothetical protein
MRTAQRPDPDQALFKFIWHDAADDRPDQLADDLADVEMPPPLRARVLGRRSVRPAALPIRKTAWIGMAPRQHRRGDIARG